MNATRANNSMFNLQGGKRLHFRPCNAIEKRASRKVQGRAEPFHANLFQF